MLGDSVEAVARPASASSLAALRVQLTVVGALVGALYADTVADLVQVWRTNEVYRHGFLIPFIALYLVWVRRADLRDLPLEPRWGLGGALAIVAGAMLIAGKVAAVAIVRELSLPLMLAGLVLVLFGSAYLRRLWLPITYLLFMIPVVAESDGAHWPFQLLAAHIGVTLLHLFGFTAYQHAELIELPRVVLEVVEACSGIRFMISVLAIGLPVVILTQRTWQRRVGLLAFAVAIGIVANGVRVAMIGMLAYYGFDAIKGPFHVLQAMFVAWIGYVALFSGVLFLQRRPPA
jgi:exosortase